MDPLKIYERLSLLIESLNIESLSKLSEKIMINRQVLPGFGRGILHNLTTRTLVSLVEETGVYLTWLFTGKGEMLGVFDTTKASSIEKRIQALISDDQSATDFAKRVGINRQTLTLKNPNHTLKTLMKICQTGDASLEWLLFDTVGTSISYEDSAQSSKSKKKMEKLLRPIPKEMEDLELAFEDEKEASEHQRIKFLMRYRRIIWSKPRNRVKAVMEILGFQSKEEFADFLIYSPSTIHSFLKDKTKPGPKFYTKLLEKTDYFSEEWLRNGVGSPRKK